MGGRNDQPLVAPPLDEAWIASAMESIEQGKPYVLDSKITNADRAVGARLAGELALQRAQRDLPADVTYRLAGTAGQSFGCVHSRRNEADFDRAGERLCRQGIIWRRVDYSGQRTGGSGQWAACDSGQCCAVWVYCREVVRGGQGWRAVRGSEFGRYSCGGRDWRPRVRVHDRWDRGCDGRVGMNFGAGMTGGLAWVYDADGSFASGNRYHPEFVVAEGFDFVGADSQDDLKALIETHLERSESGVGEDYAGGLAEGCVGVCAVDSGTAGVGFGHESGSF